MIQEKREERERQGPSEKNRGKKKDGENKRGK